MKALSDRQRYAMHVALYCYGIHAQMCNPAACVHCDVETLESVRVQLWGFDRLRASTGGKGR